MTVKTEFIFHHIRAVASDRQTEALASVIFVSFPFKCSHHKHLKYLSHNFFLAMAHGRNVHFSRSKHR